MFRWLKRLFPCKHDYVDARWEIGHPFFQEGHGRRCRKCDHYEFVQRPKPITVAYQFETSSHIGTDTRPPF